MEKIFTLMIFVMSSVKRALIMNCVKSFVNKRILIIGASSGIGKEAAGLLSRQGANLLLVARNEDKLKEVISELEGNEHRYITADMSDVGSVETIFKNDSIKNELLDGMLYTAGMTATMPLSMLKPEKLDLVMRVHFFSFVEAVRQFSKKGRYNENARIVVMSSISAKCGDKGHTAYAAAKAAIEGSVRCMASELADKKIYINSVVAGMTKTNMLKDFLAHNGEDSVAYRKVIERQYLGLADPRDIANVICFLLSPSSRFITGASIPVDGGYTSS